VTVLAHVAHPVGELGLEAKVAGGVQFGARLLVLLVALPDGRFQHLHLILLPPVQKVSISIHYFLINFIYQMVLKCIQIVMSLQKVYVDIFALLSNHFAHTMELK
jgi:hypothetical protein